MSTSTAPRPTWPDRLRREIYLGRVAVWLDDFPAREQRTLRAQLRSDIDAAAADTSMATALASLGAPRALAREYLAGLPGDRPRWNAGMLWVCSWLLLCLFTFAVFSAALLQAADAAGPDGVTARLLWTEVTAVDTPETTSLAWTSTAPWVLAVAVLAFVLGSRLWRLVPTLRPDAKS